MKNGEAAVIHTLRIWAYYLKKDEFELERTLWVVENVGLQILC